MSIYRILKSKHRLLQALGWFEKQQAMARQALMLQYDYNTTGICWTKKLTISSLWKNSKFLHVTHWAQEVCILLCWACVPVNFLGIEKAFICFCVNALYMMQLSMHSYLLQYDGFHSLHFTACGLMRVDRNNSSSLDHSNTQLNEILMFTWMVIQHETTSMSYRFSVCLQPSLTLGMTCQHRTLPSNFAEYSSKTQCSRLSSRRQTLAGGFFNLITVKHICQNVSSVLHVGSCDMKTLLL